MNLKSQQAKKLLRLKQLRADAAKARAAKAVMLLNIARVQEQQSRIHLSETRLNADQRRNERPERPRRDTGPSNGKSENSCRDMQTPL